MEALRARVFTGSSSTYCIEERFTSSYINIKNYIIYFGYLTKCLQLLIGNCWLVLTKVDSLLTEVLKLLEAIIHSGSSSTYSIDDVGLEPAERGAATGGFLCN